MSSTSLLFPHSSLEFAVVNPGCEHFSFARNIVSRGKTIHSFPRCLYAAGISHLLPIQSQSRSFLKIFSFYTSFYAMTTIKSSLASLMRPCGSNLATTALSDETLHQQLPHAEELSQAAGSRELLVISPYIETPHLLDLSTVEPQAQLLAIALAGLKSVREDYATVAYGQIFNWSEVMATLRQLCAAKEQTWTEQIFYIVVFRSQIPPTTDYSHLGVLDKAAHAEAMKSGGFLKSVIASRCEKVVMICLHSSGIGSEAQTILEGTWQLASGERKRMPDLAGLDRPIGGQQEQRETCIRNGQSTAWVF
jgi:hypothetical protein